ncbi:MAG: GNAT family N-acetyltransferase [Anaerolinea sp.]|nr:GNAT family N-acetyltransferase [Anaerolinea sp.]
MDIDYSFTRSIPPDDLLALFAENVWTKDRTRADVQLMLEKSVWVGAWRGNQLVGFARAVTDDLYRAFIEDVMVLESARGQGIGLALVRALLGRLAHVQEILLGCENHLVGFYEQVGFTKHNQNTMHIWKGLDWAH